MDRLDSLLPNAFTSWLLLLRVPRARPDPPRGDGLEAVMTQDLEAPRPPSRVS